MGALTGVNEAVIAGGVQDTMIALQHPALQLPSLSPTDSLHYYQLLKVWWYSDVCLVHWFCLYVLVLLAC